MVQEFCSVQVFFTEFSYLLINVYLGNEIVYGENVPFNMLLFEAYCLTLDI